jgi:hypothetical protein
VIALPPDDQHEKIMTISASVNSRLFIELTRRNVGAAIESR